MQKFVYTYLFFSAFVFSLLLVQFAKKIAIRYRVLDRPDARKTHRSARPLLGGLGIFGAMLLVIAINVCALVFFQKNAFLQNHFGQLIEQIDYLADAAPKLLAILTGATLMVAVGVIDDVKGEKFRYQYKLLAQFLAAGIVAMSGVHTSFLPFVWLNQLFSIFWIVGITNAFNLLDNMDGLSGGVAAIAAGIFFYICVDQAQFFNAVLLMTLVGSVLGFLRYNFFPAKIFMGDAGSLFLGFMLGSITLTMSYVATEVSSRMPVTIIVPLLILSLPIFDTLSVIVIRWREKRPIFKGDQRHFSHRLVDLGMSQRGAVIFIYLVALSIGVGASFLPYLPSWATVLVLLQTIAIYAMITILMLAGKKNKLNLN
jgi:UDP-GlcNAc:undecaprenyl-phosphate GlcNAc-1-phosphate transferase